MGLYATLNAAVRCPNCQTKIDAGWQFHFGDVSQLPAYAIGDQVSWGGQDLGHPSMTDVVAVGYFDGAGPFCAKCGLEQALVDIHIVNHVIQDVQFRSSEPWSRHTLFVGPDRRPC